MTYEFENGSVINGVAAKHSITRGEYRGMQEYGVGGYMKDNTRQIVVVEDVNEIIISTKTKNGKTAFIKYKNPKNFCTYKDMEYQRPNKINIEFDCCTSEAVFVENTSLIDALHTIQNVCKEHIKTNSCCLCPLGTDDNGCKLYDINPNNWSINDACKVWRALK